MPWFQRASKSRSKASREGGFAQLVPSRESLATAGRWTLRFLFASLLGGAVFGSFEVEKKLRRDERFYLETWRIETGALPEWVTPDIRAEIEGIRLAGEGAPLSLFSPGVLARVREALERTPWIKKVSGVQVRYPTFEKPGVLGLELHVRRPVALVEQGGLFYLVDAEGVRVGAPYADAPTDWFGVPAITGTPAPGVLPAPGERWASRDVLQGVEVAKVLFENGIQRDYPDRPLQSIDLTNLHGRIAQRESEIVLWCGKQRLAWGRSPISEGPRTATTAEIVSNLRKVLSNFDAYNNLAVIHLHRRPDSLTGVRG